MSLQRARWANPSWSRTARTTDSMTAEAPRTAEAHQYGERLNISPKIAASSPPKQQANKLTQSIHIADCRAVATHAGSIETHVRVKIIALQRQSTIRSPSHPCVARSR